MDHRFEIWNQGSLIFGEEYISIIRKSENVQILINEIKKIKIYKGILGNIKIRINLNDKYYIVSILFRDLSIILEEIKTLNKQNETLIIEMFSEKNNFIIMGENNIKKSNKVKKGSVFIRLILSILLIVLIVFGNPIYKIINEQLFDRYYSKISIENKMEKIFDETVQKNCSIRLEKNRDIDEVLVARIECNYSEKDYEKIHDFLQQLSKLNMVNYKLIMVYINDDIVKNISNNSLSIDNNIVWQKGEKQEEIVCHPDSRNTYGTIIEICNLYNRPQGYRIKEYYTGNEIIVEDSSISSIGYSYEFEYEVGDFVEIIGEPFNDYYIPDARIYSFDINDMNN